MADEDILGKPQPKPEETPAHRPLVCEFCECRLTGSGQVLRRSERARALQKAEEEVERLEGTVATLRAEIEAAKAPAPISTEGPKQKGLII